MDASALSEYKRNRALLFFNLAKGLKKEQPDVKTSEVVMNRTVGNLAFRPTPQPPVFSLDEMVVQRLLDHLTYTATNNFGPTKSSRLNYIFMFTVASAYNWVKPILTGIKDSWNWDTHYATESDMDTHIFVNHALIAVLPTLIPRYDVRTLLVDEQLQMGFTPDTQTTYVNTLSTTTHFSQWVLAWQTWHTGRLNDGNIAAAVPPTPSQLPNGAITLDVNNSQDISAYPNPTQWTPLFIQNKTTQKYMTWSWNDVTSSCLSPSDEAAIRAAADAYYPDTKEKRDEDIATLVSTIQNLQDSEKVQAEFWAGQPFTVSPPGMYVYIWAMFALSSKFAHTKGMDSFITSGFQLATTLFEIGRIVWGLKKIHMQARPIQEIRSRYAGQPLRAYDGTTTDGSLWIPYQSANVVTPPFADFPSGHSAFGQSFVRLMTTWFGPDIEKTQAIPLTKMSLLSGVFSTIQVQSPGTFLFPKGASQIQPGVVPADDFLINYTTWEDMAASCGFSRQCGGIHATSANLGSVAAANALFPLVQAAWGFQGHP